LIKAEDGPLWGDADSLAERTGSEPDPFVISRYR
jgi:hypothetical protein